MSGHEGFDDRPLHSVAVKRDRANHGALFPELALAAISSSREWCFSFFVGNSRGPNLHITHPIQVQVPLEISVDSHAGRSQASSHA